MNVHQRRTALGLLAAILVVTAIGLAPELTISRVDLNDNAFHYPLIADMVRQMERGANPFDWWAPEWSLGYPVLRTYQPLAHFLVALVYFGLFKSVSLMTVFIWVRFLSVLLLPLTFFITARLLSLSWLTAAASAMLAPLISSAGLYGLEYGSYLWAGSGLFTQAIAQHFFLLTLGFGYRALRRGSGLAIAGIFLGLTFLAHFIYGYMGALSLCLLALIPNREAAIATRIARTAFIGAIAFVLAAFELVPMILDSSIINHSRWEAPWKWDSFGAGEVMKLLFTGNILDHNRLPVLTLLALAGAIVYFRGRNPARTFLICGAALWILMFFGRPFWGPLLVLLGVSPDMQLHRVVGGAQVFLVFLSAMGLAAMWRIVTSRSKVVVTIVVTAILFYPMIRERASYLSNNRQWGYRSLGIYEANKTALDAAIAIARDRGGRAYAGLAATWGGKFRIGDPQVYAYLSEARVPTLGFMYHSMSLSSETMTRFDEFSPAHYRLFDIQTVIAPEGVNLPPFLAPIVQTGPLRILEAPGGGYFDVVDVFYAVHVTKENFYDVNDRWQQSLWVQNHQHLLLDLRGDAPAPMSRLGPYDALPASQAFPYPGVVLAEQASDQDYHAEIQAQRRSYVLFKMTWHPNWRATVDGAPVATAMLSPGFVGIPVEPGDHKIEIRYEAEAWKSVLALVGLLLVCGVAISEWRGWFAPRFHFAIPSFVTSPAAGLVLLSLPVCIALMTSKLPNGHDATAHLPRMVEFHENIVHGILLPRWAPDLNRGAGEPLFLFYPPLFYYLGEVWHLIGFAYVQSMNLALIVLTVASAFGMFLLGRLYFGTTGGWLAAVAYLYAPYFAVDLYVRSAVAEFAAFPFFAFALYGFGAYAKSGRRKYLLMGAVAFACLPLCHNPAPLLFAPMLAAFIVFHAWHARSWRLLMNESAGFALGLGLSAFVWFPSITQNHNIQVATLLQGYSHYANHFVYLHQLFDSPWGYGLSVAGDQDGLSFALGWSHLLLAALAIVFSGKNTERRWIWFFAAIAVVFCWMMLPSSQPVWEHVHLLQFVQFPWRWLGSISVAVAMLVAATGPLIDRIGKWEPIALGGALALLIVPNLSHLHPLSSIEVDPALLTPRQVAQRGMEVSSFGEFRPRWMQDTPPYDPQPAEILSGSATYRQTGKGPTWWSGAFDAGTAALIQMNIAWFPGWRLRIDGASANAWPADRTGLIRFEIPPGHHSAVLAWDRTPALWTGDTVSLLALAILLLAAVAGHRSPESISADTMDTARDSWPASPKTWREKSGER